MKLGIVIATYQRLDGTTPIYLNRALKSITEQIHQDYKVYLIGDKYEDNNEFVSIAKSIVPADKLYYENLSVAVERDRYPNGGIELWRCGGANAFNHGIAVCFNDNIKYICTLDHDDYWSNDHLSSINEVIEQTNGDAAVIYTCGTYFQNHLPLVQLDNRIIHDIPKPGGALHSTLCIDHSKIYLKYRDTAYELNKPDAGDADLLQRLGDEVERCNFKSYLIQKLTCFHPEEGNTIHLKI